MIVLLPEPPLVDAIVIVFMIASRLCGHTIYQLAATIIVQIAAIAECFNCFQIAAILELSGGVEPSVQEGFQKVSGRMSKLRTPRRGQEEEEEGRVLPRHSVANSGTQLV